MIHTAVIEAWQKGALIVAAAGNSGAGNVACPACYPEVIAVSAIDQNDQLGSGSSTGSKVELSAPGVHVYSTCFQGSQLLYYLAACWDQSVRCCNGLLYDYVDGTSFAAPFVSAIAALAWDYNIQQGTNTLSNQNIRDALDTYVTDLGASGRDTSFGFGKPNAFSLLNSMVSSHSYTLSARWEYFSSSGTETSARIAVYDGTIGQYVSSDTPLGNNGQVINVPTAHTIGVFFNYYYNDGSHWVYVHQVDGQGGAPTYNDAHSIKCSKYFTFGAVTASNQATYWIGTANNDPYAGTTC